MNLIKSNPFAISGFELPKIELPKFSISKTKIPKLKIGDLSVKVPIIQGGMGVGISLSGLAAAVANEGGIGVIAANAIGLIEPDYFENGMAANLRALRKEIRKARQLSDGVLGVNLMLAVKDFHNLLDVCIEEKIDLVVLGAGLPLKDIPVANLRKNNVKVVPIVSSARAVKLIFGYWQKKYDTVPDAVVVEGPMAGGHLGFKLEQIDDPEFALEKIVPQVVSELKTFEQEMKKEIPVIAAGGIFTGADIYRFFNLGAKAVQMGTRFVATDECDADPDFKQAYINCRKEDVAIIKSPVGLWGRAIKNIFISEVESGVKKFFRCPWRCLASCDVKNAKYCISEALNSARLGDLKNGFAFAGSNAYRVEKIIPVRELFLELKNSCIKAAETGKINLKQELEKAIVLLKELKEEYTAVLEKGIKGLKDDYNRVIMKGTKNLKEELARFQEKIEKLKTEYIKHYEETKKISELMRSNFYSLIDIQFYESKIL